MRLIVDATAPAERSNAVAAARDVGAWRGLWVARIEHFEKVAGAGLRVRPHYGVGADGSIVSDVHVAVGPFAAWFSAAGALAPAANADDAAVTLDFDDFWVGGDAAAPRPPPAEEDASFFDAAVRAVGRAAFLPALAAFPVDFADMEGGVVAFRFPPLDSCIVARRDAGGRPRRPGPREVP